MREVPERSDGRPEEPFREHPQRASQSLSPTKQSSDMLWLSGDYGKFQIVWCDLVLCSYVTGGMEEPGTMGCKLSRHSTDY